MRVILRKAGLTEKLLPTNVRVVRLGDTRFKRLKEPVSVVVKEEICVKYGWDIPFEIEFMLGPKKQISYALLLGCNQLEASGSRWTLFRARRHFV